jgi:hypothetical protein
VARYLSAEWFAEIARAAPQETGDGPLLVLEQVVHDTPDGEVRYRVVVSAGTAHIELPLGQANGATTAPDLTIASDWATAIAVAQGHLSAQAALMAGRLRIRGSLARLASRGAGLAGLDPVPPDVRRRTTY